MRRRPRIRRAAATVLALAALVAGCSGSPPVRLYVLAPLAAADAAGGVGGTPGLAVGVGPVTVAPHLDRPQIVTRRGNQVHLEDFDRWAEPLQDGIAATIAGNLSALLGSERVWTHPWRPSQPVELQVLVDVLRCDLDAGGEALLDVRWTVFDRDGELVAARRSTLREAAAGPAAAAGALSRSLAALSRDIAAVLEEERPAGSGGR